MVEGEGRSETLISIFGEGVTAWNRERRAKAGGRRSAQSAQTQSGGGVTCTASILEHEAV